MLFTSMKSPLKILREGSQSHNLRRMVYLPIHVAPDRPRLYASPLMVPGEFCQMK